MDKGKLFDGIDTVIVRVSDIGEARTWYTEKLQLAVVWDDPTTKLVVLDAGGPTSLTLWQGQEPLRFNKDTASFPIFKTNDAKAVREEIKSRGVDVGELTTDDAVTYFHFYDPDGNILEACQVHG